MRILGIDPGLQITGYGCVEMSPDRADPRVIEAGIIRLRRAKPMPDRLGQLFDELREIIEELRPDRMVVEQLFSHYRHARTSILMGHARGVVLLAGQLANVTLDELSPNEIKKAITGHGHATKSQMQHAVMAQCGLPALPEPSDVADAIGIALCAARRVEVETLTSN